MHFDVFVEDESGSIVVDVILGKILGENGTFHSWRMKSYKGLGHIPKGLRGKTDPAKRVLLDQLPRILRGYGDIPEYGDSPDASSAVVVVVDLDNRDCMAFKQELLEVLNACRPRPKTLFRIAIEEIEAWLLGDHPAVKAAYPGAKDSVLDRYRQDAICGTWEVLADAIHAGGAAALKKEGWPAPGKAKCEWAREIAQHMIPTRNRSPSFQVFRDGVLRLADTWK